MTEQQDFDKTPPVDESATHGFADEPIPDAAGDAGSDGAAGSARAREWLSQLESMIQDIATQAAPVARQVGAKAAELAAVAAVKAGPLAQKAAEVTTDVGQRFAERAQSVAAELRGDVGAPATPPSAPDAPVEGEPPSA